MARSAPPAEVKAIATALVVRTHQAGDFERGALPSPYDSFEVRAAVLPRNGRVTGVSERSRSRRAAQDDFRDSFSRDAIIRSLDVERALGEVLPNAPRCTEASQHRLALGEMRDGALAAVKDVRGCLRDLARNCDTTSPRNGGT